MKYPKTQPGNPHRLTINQHIFPKKSITRFTGDQGTVQVRWKNGEKDIVLNPKDKLFCAIRKFDQRSETGYMKDIEDRYQNVAQKIVNNEVNSLDFDMNEAVTDLYLLWTLRHHFNLNPIPDIHLNCEGLTRHYSIDEQESLEAAGVIFISPDKTFASRFMTGISVLRQLDAERQRMIGKRWGIVKAIAGEFLVPDNFSAYSVLPLSPKITLIEGHIDQTIGFQQVAEINACAVSSASKYIFGRDLAQCPVAKLTPFRYSII